MGCISSTDVLDEKFEVTTDPDTSRNFLKDPKNWLNIIPGVSNGEIFMLACTAIIPDWKLQSRSNVYMFTNIADINSTETPVGLKYTVHITGPSYLDFSFNVQYDFVSTTGASGCTIHRRVFDLSVNRLSCLLGNVIKSELIKGCLKENNNMAALLQASLCKI
jgi:hypothetical protein